MTQSDIIMLGTVIIAAIYANETHKMRIATCNQLEALRKAALLSAYASLYQININIVEIDHQDTEARQMEHFKRAMQKVSESVKELERLIDELKMGAK